MNFLQSNGMFEVFSVLGTTLVFSVPLWFLCDFFPVEYSLFVMSNAYLCTILVFTIFDPKWPMIKSRNHNNRLFMRSLVLWMETFCLAINTVDFLKMIKK